MNNYLKLLFFISPLFAVYAENFKTSEEDKKLNAAIDFAEQAEALDDTEDAYAADFDTKLSGTSYSKKAQEALTSNFNRKMLLIKEQKESNFQSLMTNLADFNLETDTTGVKDKYISAFDAFEEELKGTPKFSEESSAELKRIKENIFKLKSLLVYLDKLSRDNVSEEQRKSIDTAIREIGKTIKKEVTKLYAFSGADNERQLLVSEIDDLDEAMIGKYGKMAANSGDPLSSKDAAIFTHGIFSEPRIEEYTTGLCKILKKYKVALT